MLCVGTQWAAALRQVHIPRSCATILFSRDAENSSREIVLQNANTPDESVAERVFPR